MSDRPIIKIAPADLPSDMNIEERLVSLNDQVAALTAVPTTKSLSRTPSPQITSGLVSNGVGVQFAFNQLSLSGIDGYRVYKSSTNSFTSATQLEYLKHSALLTTSVTVVDTVPAGTSAYYWITAVSTNGLESAPTAAQAASVASGSVVDLSGLVGSTKTYPGIQLNSTNFATVDSIDAGSNATIRIYGSGGVGTSWTRQVGSTTEGPFPSGNITGLSYNTKYNIMYDGTQFFAFTAFPSTLPDNLKFVGSLTTVPSSGGTTATATAVITGTGVNSVTITNGGTGYASAPTVSFTGGGGTGAAGTATLDGSGHVNGVSITSAGTGYTSAPTVGFTGGGGSGAAGTAVLVGTSVAQVNVTGGGSGYTVAPTVTINGGGGTGASAYSTVSGGAVISVTLTNAGSGYTSAPTVAFSGGQTGTTGGGGTTGTPGGARYNAIA
jgi:hypothetical protein